LDKKEISPYEFYQFFFNTADEDCEKLLQKLTFLDFKEISNVLIL